MAEDGTRVRVRCTDCQFEKVVASDDDEKPAEILIDHGQRTGHKLTVERIDDEER